MSALISLLNRTIMIVILCTTLLLNECVSKAGPKGTYEFNSRSTTDDILRQIEPNLQGKIAIVTGATSGLGRETTKALAWAGCKVIMAVRDVRKADLVRREIITELKSNYDEENPDATPRPRIRQKYFEYQRNMEIWPLNLGSLQSVLNFAKRYFRENPGKIDLLILNAGVMAIPDFRKTPDGFEQQIGINYLGHYYLARLLTNKVVEGAYGITDPGRVIVVSSRAHSYAPEPISGAVSQLEGAVRNINLMKMGYKDWKNYGISKAFQILFARELQRRELYRDIIAVSLHPGVIKSGLQRYMTDDAIATKTFDKSIKEGTATQLLLAILPKEMISRGGYYDDCKLHEDRLRDDLKPSIDDFYNKDDEEVEDTLEFRLWEASEHIIEAQGFHFDFKVGDYAYDPKDEL